MPLTAAVAVWNATIYYDKLYTYMVPAPLEGHIFVGSLVLVPFGRGKARPRIGVVLEVVQAGEVDGRVKQLLDVAPEEAGLTEELLSIVKYLKQATFCTWYEAVKAVLPYGAQYKTEQVEGEWRLKQSMSRHTEPVYALAEDALPAGVWGGAKCEVISGLRSGESGLATQEPAKPLAKRLTEKQQAVLDLLADGPLTRAELLAATGVGRGVPDALVSRGLLVLSEQDKRLTLDDGYLKSAAAPGSVPAPALSPAQQVVTDTLKQRMAQAAPKPALLYGVTGSGKTPVFLELVQAALDAGKTALVLVPEIGLTPQMLAQLRGRFGGLVAVQHSGMSNTARLLQWRAIQRGEARVVVGTRSAVFAPLEQIGLIVADEEQERTYQSESAPRYDAIEVARRRAAHHGALLLLASATPAVTDYYLAGAGRYELFSLHERYGNIPLPAVELVDMGAELNAGNTGILSRRLTDGIREALDAGGQVILLLNRRGYHRVGLCRECGEALKCGDCSVPMVFHKAGRQTAAEAEGEAEAGQKVSPGGGRMLCHYCGKTLAPAPSVCPECGGEMRYMGFGTQRMEQELESLFPSRRVLRMDLDSTGRRGAHAEMLGRFARGEYDILLGTQMVAKGLDFERVNLVGVIGIDSLLFSQGYRAYETVFSLVTQVVGRSGRSGAQGRAMIQTVDVENPILTMAAKQDYAAFYRQEIAFRKMSLYPPFCTICVIGFAAKQEADALAASRRFAQLLAGIARRKPGLPLRVLGPAPMSMAMLAGVYRYRLTLKCRKDADLFALLQEILEQYNREGLPAKASVSIDFHSDAGA